jgi:predicted transcriptional regulator
LRPRAPRKASAIIAATDEQQPAEKARSGSEKRQRPHVVGVRLDAEEKRKLDELASSTGLSIGAFVRAAALKNPGVRSRRRAPVDRDLLGRANADLNRVGNNINQIAAALHQGREPPFFLREAIDELRETLSVIRQAAGYDRQG